MCQNLGENLVIFYFADEFDDINELQRSKDLNKFAAARGVLGVGYPELGAAIAKSWNLPRSITDSIRGLPAGPIHKPVDEAEQIRDIAVFSNELCDLFQNHELDDVESEMQALLARFSSSVELKPEYCAKLVNAGFEKLKQFAPIFEINIASSNYCQSVQSWLDLHMDAPEAEDAATKKA
jgi:HD-like signal output (HDOD) protein